MNLLKLIFITFTITLQRNSNAYSYTYSQCPVIYSYNNCITEYCYCPILYEKHIVEYTSGYTSGKYTIGKKCYFCQPNCNDFKCSLIHCYCEKGYKKAKIGECYKCLLEL